MIIPTHVVPETYSDERMHVLDHVGACWCRPLNEFVPDEHDGGRNQWRVTHRAEPPVMNSADDFTLGFAAGPATPPDDMRMNASSNPTDLLAEAGLTAGCGIGLPSGDGPVVQHCNRHYGSWHLAVVAAAISIGGEPPVPTQTDTGGET